METEFDWLIDFAEALRKGRRDVQLLDDGRGILTIEFSSHDDLLGFVRKLAGHEATAEEHAAAVRDEEAGRF